MGGVAYAANGMYDVIADYSAAGDGSTDDTSAFQNALNQANSDGGGLVTVPSGEFKISTHLSIPANVALEGTFRGPAGETSSGTQASVLLASEYNGSPTATPFITMSAGSALSGLVIRYPSQTETNPPVSYPWTIRGNGAAITIANVLLKNSYQGIDLNTNGCERFVITHVNGQPLNTGIYVGDSDRGRIEDVKFSQIWSTSANITNYTEASGVAFKFGDADYLMGLNLHAEHYDKAIEFASGTATAVITHPTALDCDYGIDIATVDGDVGVSFMNGNFKCTKALNVGGSNTGPVKLLSSMLEPDGSIQEHITCDGDGALIVSGCTLVNWGTSYDAIEGKCEGIVVHGNNFDIGSTGVTKVSLDSSVKDAAIGGNRMENGVNITDNTTNADVDTGYNTAL